MKKLNSILLVAAIITFIACLWVNVDRNKTIENSHTVRYIAAEGGYIDGETEQLVEDGGSSDVVIARPNSGYEFAGWSDGVSAAGRRELYVHNNITVTAYFTPTGGTTDPNDPSDPSTEAPDDKKTYTLHYTASGGGYILAKDGTISGSVLQEVTEGDNGMRVTAVANTGYEFVRWSDGVTTATRTDSNVTSDITVTAEFRRIELTLTYTAGTGGSITGETSQPVLYGESGTAVTAVPEEGYVFVRWSDGVTIATRTDSNVTSDITVTAEFAPDADYKPFASGDGSEENPYQIDSVRRLRSMELYSDAHYVLTADIVLSEAGEGGSNFAPLFSDEGMFGGTLDGQGHKIVNLTVYNTETFYSGLFSCISASGSVTNLVLENASVSGTNYIGGIAGYTLGAVTGCTVTGSITHLGGNGYKVFAGGIAGRAEASVDGCVTDVTVTVEDARAETNVGGIVGYLAYSGSQSESMTLAADGSVTVSASGGVYAGGLIGRSRVGLYLSDSYATGDVKSTCTDGNISRVGGLVGYGVGTVTVTDSYATGNVTSTGYDSRAGGLVGDGYTVTVRNSYSVSCVSAEGESGNVYIGGIAGYVDGSLTLENAHWYGGDGTAAEYAVGYSNSLGIPTSMGSTRHNALEEFYTLADALNAGREEPVWEHKDENTLPTLIEKTQENEEETL